MAQAASKPPTDVSDEAGNDVRGRRWPSVLAAMGVLTALAYWQVPTHHLTDRDTLMLIAEARVDDAGDLVSQLGMKLTGGRAGRDANFYRPVVNLWFVALRSLFGWSPAGYHVFALAVHALNAALLYALAWALGGRARLAHRREFAAVSAAFFALHPVGSEVLPGIARIADPLMTLFVLAAMLAMERLLRELESESRPAGAIWRGVAGVTALYAIAQASKEPAIFFPAMAAATVLLLGRSPWRRRLGQIAIIGLPCAPVALVYLLIRSQVLAEGLGGYHLEHDLLVQAKYIANLLWLDLSFPGLAPQVELVLPAFYLLPLIVFPQIWVPALAVIGLAVWRRRALAAWLRSDSGRVVSLVAVVLGLHIALWLTTRVYDRRLLYLCVAFVSFLPGLIAVWVRTQLAVGHLPRGRNAVGLFAAVTAGLLFLVQSPLFRSESEWQSSGETTRLVTDSLRASWSNLPAGSKVALLNLPRAFAFEPMRRVLYSGQSSTYTPIVASVQAWLDDQLPEKRIHVTGGNGLLYRTPVAAFRHEVELDNRTLRFNTPPDSRPSVERQLGGIRSLSFEWVGEDRLALRGRFARANKGLYLLVFDGHEPRFIALRDLATGRSRRRPGA